MSNNNAEIFFDNVIQDAQLSATNGDPDFPLESIRWQNQGKVFRTTTIAESQINMSFPTATAIEGIVCLNHNIVSGELFVFEASDNGFATVADYRDIDPTLGYVQVSWNFSDYRLRFQKSSGDHMQIGEGYLPASYYQLARNFSRRIKYYPGVKFTNIKTSGPVYRDKKSQAKEFHIDWTDLPVPDSQAAVMEQVIDNAYVCFVPGLSVAGLPTRAVFYGYFEFPFFEKEYADHWQMAGFFQESSK